MPRIGCLALHRVNPNFLKEEKKIQQVLPAYLLANVYLCETPHYERKVGVTVIYKDHILKKHFNKDGILKYFDKYTQAPCNQDLKMCNYILLIFPLVWELGWSPKLRKVSTVL